MLNYGALNKDHIQLQLPFSENENFLLARIGATSPDFPGSSAYPKGYILGAATGFSKENVKIRAFAELVERLSAFSAGVENKENIVTKKNVSESWYKDNMFWAPPNIEVSWVNGINLSNGYDNLVPALLSYLNWRPIEEKQQIFLKPSATGLAAHTNKEASIINALLEVVERDIAMISWRLPRWKVRKLNQNILKNEYHKLINELSLKVELWNLGELFGIPVVLSALSKADNTCLTIGTCTAETLEYGAEKSLNEALMLQWSIRQIDHCKTIETPKNSLDHVLWAYQNGPTVLKHFHGLEDFRNSDLCQGFNDLKTVISNLKQVYKSPMFYVDVSDQTAKNEGWFVSRCIIPDAIPRETNSKERNILHPRYKRLQKAYNFDEMLNELPHPYG